MSKWFAVLAVVSVTLVNTLSGYAGPVGGKIFKSARVEANSAKTFTFDIEGSEFTAIYIHGDGDTDLDVYVYDHLGNLLKSGTGASDQELVILFSDFQQTITVHVVNRGRVYNEFALVAYTPN